MILRITKKITYIILYEGAFSNSFVASLYGDSETSFIEHDFHNFFFFPLLYKARAGLAQDCQLSGWVAAVLRTISKAGYGDKVHASPGLED